MLKVGLQYHGFTYTIIVVSNNFHASVNMGSFSNRFPIKVVWTANFPKT